MSPQQLYCSVSQWCTPISASWCFVLRFPGLTAFFEKPTRCNAPPFASLTISCGVLHNDLIACSSNNGCDCLLGALCQESLLSFLPSLFLFQHLRIALTHLTLGCRFFLGPPFLVFLLALHTTSIHRVYLFSFTVLPIFFRHLFCNHVCIFACVGLDPSSAVVF